MLSDSGWGAGVFALGTAVWIARERTGSDLSLVVERVDVWMRRDVKGERDMAFLWRFKTLGGNEKNWKIFKGRIKLLWALQVRFRHGLSCCGRSQRSMTIDPLTYTPIDQSDANEAAVCLIVGPCLW